MVPVYCPHRGTAFSEGTSNGTGAGYHEWGLTAKELPPSSVGQGESQAAFRKGGTPRPQPGKTRGRAAPHPGLPLDPNPGWAPRGCQHRRCLLLTCRGRLPGPHLGGVGRARIRAADTSGRGASGSPAAASLGLRGTRGRSRHARGLPQEVDPPSHPHPAGLAAPAPRVAPPPALPRPLGSAPSCPNHHREGRGARQVTPRPPRAPPGGAEVAGGGAGGVWAGARRQPGL